MRAGERASSGCSDCCIIVHGGGCTACMVRGHSGVEVLGWSGPPCPCRQCWVLTHSRAHCGLPCQPAHSAPAPAPAMPCAHHMYVACWQGYDGHAAATSMPSWSFDHERSVTLEAPGRRAAPQPSLLLTPKLPCMLMPEPRWEGLSPHISAVISRGLAGRRGNS